MKRQGGFTLIEMIVVIVILGILAVTAAPKFLNFQDDARKASISGLKGAIDSAASLVYGKAALEGKEKSDDTTVDSIKTVYGYPAIADGGIDAAVEGLTRDWVEVTITGKPATSTSYSFKDASDEVKQACYVTYYQALNASTAAYAEVTCGS